MYLLKNYKKDINSQIEKLQIKKQAIKNENLKNLIDRKIKKLFFHLSTYSQQIFDLYFQCDTLKKYNFDLLHFDLFLKNENLNQQLLYYRLIDKIKTDEFKSYSYDNEYVKGIVFDKTEKNIINRITNEIILNEIEKQDKIKLEFIKTYYKNFYK